MLIMGFPKIQVEVPIVCFLQLMMMLTLTEQARLTDYILDFQPLTYDPLDLHIKHERVRRSVDTHFYLQFQTYGKNYRLRLKRDDSIFAHDHSLKESDGFLRPIDISFIYSGEVEDVPGSFAHIAVINGTARGYFTIPGDTTYHVEPAAMYFKDPEFHTLVYPESRMNLDPYRHRRSAEMGMCGNDDAAAWMKVHADSGIVIEQPNRAKRYANGNSHFYNKYSAKSNSGVRSRRATIGERNTCYLYLRADPVLWEHVKNKKYNTVLSDSRTQEEILAFFANHVSAVKNIYSKTEFSTYDRSMRYVGMDFVVQRTSIMTLETQFCENSKTSGYCNRNIDVTNFLNLNSLDQHDEFCLAYVFTFRDFTKGTLGLAWVGSDSRAAGGVCERHKEYPEGGARVKKSLNTGIVTVINYGKPVPARVSQLTFAHEIGHNFGSPHDSGPTCAPYGTNRKEAEDGNYIMFASATMGDKAHNDNFSICSLDNITRVLDAVLNERYGKINCFQRSTEAFCGNSITEAGEECDCGYADDCQDICCYGKGSREGPECRLRQGKKCSPTAGPCCSATCEYIMPSTGTVCQPQDDCKAQSICGGQSAQCPSAVQKPNNTFCNDYSQICHSGECVSSVCHRIGWEECFLTSSNEKDGPSKEAMCYVSCRNPMTKECVSSYSLVDIMKVENSNFKDLLVTIQQLKTLPKTRTLELPQGIQLPAGSPCNNFRGYCDVFHKCRGVDADGPLARLKNLIFDPKTLQSIKDWITIHWWAVMLMSAGLIVVMGVFIKVCAVHTPSSNPRKPKARKLTMTLRRSHNRNRGQGSGSSQTAALTSNQHGRNSRGGNGSRQNQGQGATNPGAVVAEPSRPGAHGQGSKVTTSGPSAATTAAATGGGERPASTTGAAPGPSTVIALAPVPVEKLKDPPPPYTSALLPSNSNLPPHGKGKRGKRRERGMELQRL